jgi:nucleotide-binding universal stress UspA family protein
MKMRIVLATDGTDAAVGAVHLARALSQRHAAPVEVLAVLDAIPMGGLVDAETMALARRSLEDAGRMALRQRVSDQLWEAGAEAAAWPTTIEVGPPAPTIVRFAHDRSATLIVMGLGRHALAERWFGTETALRVMRLAHVPVLAVPAETRGLPSTAVVAVDFTEFSRDAAGRTLDILEPGGTLHLVHVFWRPATDVYWVGGSDWMESQRAAMEAQLQEMARLLGRSGEVRVLTHAMEGDAAVEALRLAEGVGAELIAVGSHGSGFFSRLLMGSVSTRVVRRTTGMVLVAPPRAMPAELADLLLQEEVSAEA